MGVEIVFKKSLKNEWKIRSPGDPKIDHKSSQGRPKEAPGSFRRPFGKDFEKTVIFSPPGTVKMRLPL